MIRQVVTEYDDILTFGKFKGKTIFEVSQEEPSYIVWLDEQEIVKFPDDILDAAKRDDMENSPPEYLFWESD